MERRQRAADLASHAPALSADSTPALICDQQGTICSLPESPDDIPLFDERERYRWLSALTVNSFPSNEAR